MWHFGRMKDIGGGGTVVGLLQQWRETQMNTPQVLLFTLSLLHKHHFGVVLEVVSFQQHLLSSRGGTRLHTLLVHQRQLLG